MGTVGMTCGENCGKVNQLVFNKWLGDGPFEFYAGWRTSSG